MPHVSVYRKWRPKTFAEVIGQERVTRTLQNAIRAGRVVHAYLFAGHRGTGKTTTARIFAKALNCREGPTPAPCNVCPSCEAIGGGYAVDVIEIDAASNRGIEEIRELRDRIRLAPTEGRYKVYIIDEAHMLTPEAANALLKTLEEPPAHAILILVTTEPHRLPPTILSRCQRFDFRRVSTRELVARLRHIAQTEGFAIEERALVLIAQSADGSVRDAESVLDQLVAFTDAPITAQDVVAVLGMLDEETALRFAEAVIARDVIGCLRLLHQVTGEGRDPRQILRTLLDHFRDLLVAKTSRQPAELLDTTETRLRALSDQAGRVAAEDILRALNVLVATESEARWSPQPRLLFEIALIRLCRPEMDPTTVGLQARLAALERQVGGAPPVPAASSDQPAPPAAAEPARPARPRTAPARQERKASGQPPKAEADAAVALEEPPAPPPIAIDEVRRAWPRVLDEVRRTKMFCHALLIEGHPLELDGTTLVVGLRPGYNFHVENLHRPENRAVVEDALERVLHHRVRLRCTIADAPPSSAPAADLDPVVAAAVQLFAGRVLEIRPAGSGDVDA